MRYNPPHMATPKFTISDFRKKYHNDDVCLDEIFRLQYQHTKDCAKCTKPFNYKRVTSKSKKEGQQRKSFQCVSCGNQVYPLVGTIYEKSRTPLTYWFYAIYLMTATRNGVAAKELERQLGVTYKCAFRMAHRIRQLMSATHEELEGVVQIDEVFVGGAAKNRSSKVRAWRKIEGTRDDNKIKILGMLANDRTVYAMRIDKLSEKEILPLIVEHVKPGSVIVTDAAGHYDTLSKLGYTHISVNHSKDEWFKNGYHNNSIEGFWSQLKRTVKGTHIHISDKYAHKYIGECEFRYKHRNEPAGMFDAMLNKLV